MNLETLIIIVTQILISFALYLLIKNYFPAYFSEKGKNLATREDIEEITEKIKTVESKISIRASSEIDYNSLKRKTVLEYFGAYNNWETMLMNSHSEYGSDAELENQILIKKLMEARFNYNLKEGEAQLFIIDTEFFNIRREINPLILQLQHAFEKHCAEINYIIKIEPNLVNNHTEISESREKFNELRLEEFGNLIVIKRMLSQYLENILKQSFK